MVGYTDRKRYMKDKYNCDLIMIEGVELVPLYQIIDKLEQSVSLDRIKEATKEIEGLCKLEFMTKPLEIAVDRDAVLQILDKLIAEVEEQDGRVQR